MKLKAIQTAIPNLPREFIYYLQKKGHIKPKKLDPRQPGGLQRLEYRARDLEIIQRMWELRQDKILPKRAITLIKNSKDLDSPIPKQIANVKAYILVRIPSYLTVSMHAAMKGFKQIQEAGIVYGPWDIIAQVDAESLPHLHDIVYRLHRIHKITTETLVIANPTGSRFYWNRAEDPSYRKLTRTKQRSPMAFILIQTDALHSSLGDDLRPYSDVIAFAQVFGEADVILTLRFKDLNRLANFTNGILSKKKYRITRTTTFPVHSPKFYWRR